MFPGKLATTLVGWLAFFFYTFSFSLRGVFPLTTPNVREAFYKIVLKHIFSFFFKN